MDNQKKYGIACISIARAMKEYASTGEEDSYIVGAMLKDCMEIISNKLTFDNQQRFADWLIKKTKEETR